MKPAQDDNSNGGGTQGKVLGSSVISQPAPDSQKGKSGGGRIITDLEKTGNPGSSTQSVHNRVGVHCVCFPCSHTN